MKTDFSELTACAIEAATKAGEILRAGFGTHFRISSKEGRNNLVTEYDTKSENFILDFIKSKFPHHFFLAEESGESGTVASDEVQWVIDPLDGTVNFAHGIPIFSVSIAATLHGETLCGVVYQPILDELFVAEKGKGSFMNGKPLHVSSSHDITSSFLVTGFPYNIDSNPHYCLETFVDIVKQGIPVRRLGSAAMDLCYVACGRFDGFFEIDLHPWDVAAGVIILSEAGGKITQYDQSDYSIFDHTILATNGLLHSPIAEILSANYRKFQSEK